MIDDLLSNLTPLRVPETSAGASLVNLKSRPVTQSQYCTHHPRRLSIEWFTLIMPASYGLSSWLLVDYGRLAHHFASTIPSLSFDVFHALWHSCREQEALPRSDPDVIYPRARSLGIKETLHGMKCACNSTASSMNLPSAWPDGGLEHRRSVHTAALRL